MHKAAIVILNWNGIHYLKQFLPSALKQSGIEGVQVYVIDNGSTDGSVAWLQREYPETKLVLLEKNLGYAGGYRDGLRRISAEYYVLLNSDVEAPQGWLEPLLEHMDAHPEVAACQPKIRAYHSRNYFEYAGASGGYIDRYGYAFCRGRLFGTLEEDRGQYDHTVPVFWASGACLMIRAKAYREAGELDADFFAHMEEIDLCWRFRSLGYEISCVPESVVYHVGGGTLQYLNPGKTYLNFRNNLYLLYKNLPGKQKNKVLFLRRLLDAIALFRFLFTGRLKHARAVLKAHLEYRKHLPVLKKKREEIGNKAPFYYGDTIMKGSLLWQYFAGGRKTFTRLLFRPSLYTDDTASTRGSKRLR